MISLAFLPISVPSFTFCRRMSPVDRCVKEGCEARILEDTVPLPPPGGPRIR
jgi:hypothetical protein